jgi:Type I phosphodiesterase / nucleotide pyrophosphatase
LVDMGTSAQTGTNRKRTRPRRKRAHVAVALALAVGLGAAGYGLTLGSLEDERIKPKGAAPEACLDTPQAVLQRLRRGYLPKRSGDVLAVERFPNQFGTRHAAPWPYTQDIPLVLYGPGFIRRGFSSDRDVTLADVAPTFAELLNFDGLGERDGRALSEALLPPDRRNGVPKLIITVVWDGGGINMLEQWPGSWPNLKTLIGKSASFGNATVGSSPSITPSTHATLGTGFFPSSHGLTDVPVRIGGRIVDSWEKKSPENLKVETLADLWDRANGNAPLIGLLARDSWHAGMIGHGSFLEGGDKDILVLDALGELEFTSNTEHYSFPAYASSFGGLEEAVQEVDLRDGEADREWLGHPMNMDGKIRETPAWSIFQTQRLFEILETEGFGLDDVPDLFFTNYKPTDLTGHSYNLVEPEVKQNLEEQDRQLKAIVQGLNDIVGRDNYVLALTADHGVTPYPEVTGGWSIVTRELTKDLERRFNTAMPERDLVTANRGYQFFLNREVLRANDLTFEDISAFIRNYRLHENETDVDSLPDRFKDRLNERIYLTAMSGRELELPACRPD